METLCEHLANFDISVMWGARNMEEYLKSKESGALRLARNHETNAGKITSILRSDRNGTAANFFMHMTCNPTSGAPYIEMMIVLELVVCPILKKAYVAETDAVRYTKVDGTIHKTCYGSKLWKKAESFIVISQVQSFLGPDWQIITTFKRKNMWRRWKKAVVQNRLDHELCDDMWRKVFDTIYPATKHHRKMTDDKSENLRRWFSHKIGKLPMRGTIIFPF